MAGGFASGLAEQVWSAGCRYAVVTCTLRRPGRGRSAAGSNRRGWRAEDRPAVLSRLDRTAAALVQGLAAGTVGPAEARARVADAGLAGAVHVAASLDELAAVLAGVVRAGDNVWTDCSPDSGGVAYLRWWSDPSHPRHAEPGAAPDPAPKAGPGR